MQQTQHEDQKEPEEVDSEHIVKIVIMGDGASGKSCFLFAYSKNAFPECYIPTVFENYTASDYIHGHHFKFGLWDTAGQEDYDRLRPLSYPDTDCGLICFHIDNPQSLQNVSDKWVPEFRHHCPTTPFLIVGMKADLREDEYTKKYLKDRKLSFVSKEDGLALAKKVGAYTYAECSAKTLDGVRHVFEEVASCLLDEKKTRKKKQCIIQ